jgi:acetylornithine deacetylase/succinyl-diaminopimelate desuccinylase-like protein
VKTTRAAAPSTLEKVFARIDQDEACQLALDICAVPSPTGEEAAVAEFMLEWFGRQGFRSVRQEVESGRLNAVGILPGASQGASLMFNGHLDTGTPMRHEDIVGIVPLPPEPSTPRREDGVLYGVGMDNMKSGIAAFMIAAAAIKRSGISLSGDLIMAGVAGEIGRAPVDQYQGKYYRSKGVGTRYLLTHGIVSDYAIVADTSHFGLTWVECGVLYLKIATHARGLYTPFTSRTTDYKQSANAILRMIPLIDALERWAVDYEKRSIYPFGGGEVHPKVSIGSIMAGAPFRVANTPLGCSIYVDIRVPPNKLPIEVLREVRQALGSAGVEFTMDPYLTQRGYEGEGVEPLVEALQGAHEFVIGQPIRTIHPGETSMWTDTNLYHEAGIPAVKFGIGGVLRDSPQGERFGKVRVPDTTSVDDLIKAAKMYAAASLAICGVTAA